MTLAHKSVVAALVVAATLGVAGCGDSSSSAGSKPKTFDAHGIVEVGGQGSTRDGQTCEGSGGYGDMVPGGQVTIYNAAGEAIALGSLNEGTSLNFGCVFDFDVSDVPAQDGSDIYSVEVTHRGQIKFTRAEASSLALTLGG